MPHSRLALLLAAFAVALPAGSAHAQGASPALYSITDLGPLAGDSECAASGLNNGGQVVGVSDVQGQYPRVNHSVLWSRGVPAAIPTLAGAGVAGSEFDSATAVNDSGWVVGGSVTSAGFLPHAYLWTAANGIQDLGVFPGGRTSSANAINSSGAVAGYADSGDNPAGQGLSHAFLWVSGVGLRDLGTLGGQSSSAAGINATNQVVGTADTANQYQHAFLWSSAQGLQDLGVEPGDYNSYATAVNDAGVVVGDSGSGQGEHAFVWDAAHGMQDIGTLGGSFTEALGVNSSRQIVGSSVFAWNFTPTSAYVWDTLHGMRDLNTLIAPSEWHLAKATAINNRGQIAGFGTIRGVSHAFLLTPAPPITIVLSPANVVNGSPSSATVSLNANATTGLNPFDGAVEPGVYIRLTSSKPVATFSGNLGVAPDGKTYIYVPQGQSQATFTVNTGATPTLTVAGITASFSGGSQTANLTISPTGVQSLTLSPTSVLNGNQSTGTVTLNAPASLGTDPFGNVYNGAFVTLTSSLPQATFSGDRVYFGPNGVPFIYIPPGDTQATFTINAGYVGTSTPGRVFAAIGSSAKAANLTITPTLVQSLTLSPTSVINGNQSKGTVTLASPAFAGPDLNGNIQPGVLVKLTSSLPQATFGGVTVIQGPDASLYVYVPQGQTQATFAINTGAVTTASPSKITASLGASTASAFLTVTPTLVQSLTLSPASVINGGQSTGTITLASPAFGRQDLIGNTLWGVLVKLTSTLPQVTFSGDNVVQGSDSSLYVYIPLGQSQATFTVNTGYVGASTPGRIVAAIGSSAKAANFTITPTLVQSVVLSPASVINGGQSTGTITLASPALAGPDLNGAIQPGVLVKLTSSLPQAAFSGANVVFDPNGTAFVYIPQGATQGTFTINTGVVATATAARITASLGASTTAAILTITPTLVQSVVLSPNTIVSNGQTTGTVTLASPALAGPDLNGNIQPGVLVKLTSTLSQVTFSGANVVFDPNGAAFVYIPQGSTQAAFTVTAGTVTASTPGRVIAAFGTSARAANLTINP